MMNPSSSNSPMGGGGSFGKSDEEATKQSATLVATGGPTDSDTSKKSSNYDNSKTKVAATAVTEFCRQAWSRWKSRNDFCAAQAGMVIVLAAAWIGNNWPHSYPRDANANGTMFWVTVVAIIIAAVVTAHHDPASSSRGLQVVSRQQTEEWKGWMQWCFIMYHYYRARFVYNEIRVFVSSYVFLTGWGNWQYFDKKKDFSLDRAISMWLRINYFPLLLCIVVGTPLDDFYIVPLHTTGFFITMGTAYLVTKLETRIKGGLERRKMAALGISLLAHVVFYETPLVNILGIFSKEILFRFQADKYSTWFGMVAAFYWPQVKKLAQFYNTSSPPDLHLRIVSGTQVVAGVMLIAFWYGLFGQTRDKVNYNSMHPYIFWLPVAGWLTIRNSSKYLMEMHSRALEFFGRITLETYVLQFHLFMCRHVRHIPVVVPGAGEDGNFVCKLLNMLLTGVIFVFTAFHARQLTVSTQTAVTDLVGVVRTRYQTGQWPELTEEERTVLTSKENTVSYKAQQSYASALTYGKEAVHKVRKFIEKGKKPSASMGTSKEETTPLNTQDNSQDGPV